MIATWGLTTIGAFLLSCSMNLNMAAIGLFLLGFGSNSAITVSNYIVC